jgi:hypothetical protein
MNSILILAGALLTLRLLSPILRVLIAAVAGKQVGQAALAKLPDTIHLTAMPARGRIARPSAPLPAACGRWDSRMRASTRFRSCPACAFG